MDANRERAREAERRYRAKHLDKVRAMQAAHKRDQRAADPETARSKQRDYYAKNKSRIRAQALARYNANPERERDFSRRYRTKNRERANSVVRQWRRDNPEKAKAIGRAWAAANPEAVDACRKRRKALLRGATIRDLTADQWISIQFAFDHRCAYCGKRRKGRLTQDHITPLSKGGPHTASNVVPACQSCNSRKHTGPPLRPVQRLLIA
jgi:5-methylcytosine-specific restriction endonuclease McrA